MQRYKNVPFITQKTGQIYNKKRIHEVFSPQKSPGRNRAPHGAAKKQLPVNPLTYSTHFNSGCCFLYKHTTTLSSLTTKRRRDLKTTKRATEGRRH